MIPIAVVTAFCLGRSTTIENEAGLAHAAFGWPFPWFTQDLSRYASIAYPTRMDVVGSRGNASGPIATSYDLVMFGVNALLIGVVVTAIAALIISLPNRSRARRSHLAP